MFGIPNIRRVIRTSLAINPVAGRHLSHRCVASTDRSPARPVIAFIGDAHQHIDDLEELVASLPAAVTHVIQVGDLTIRPDHLVPPRGRWRQLARPVEFIDGNHHYYTDTRGLTAPTLIRPGLTFCPRGTIGVRAGRRIGFLGGADSVTDRASRTPGVDWWPDDEALTASDLAMWTRVPPGSIDILVTHTPPASITTAMTGQPPHPSAIVLEDIWTHLGHPELVCGHMHAHHLTNRVEVLPMLGVTYR